MVFKILIMQRLPRFQAKSSSAVLTPSFAELKYVENLDAITALRLGLVGSFLLTKNTKHMNTYPTYSAIVVPIAAPLIPRAGKPQLPKINT